MTSTRFAPFQPKAVAAMVWLSLLAFPAWISTFEFGRIAAIVTIAVTVGVIVRAALVGVSTDDSGLLVRNLWRTHRLLWSDIAKIFSKTAPFFESQFVYVLPRNKHRPIRIWSSYSASHRDELLALLRRGGKGRTAGLTAEEFRRNDNAFTLWREARRRAHEDPASVSEARRDFLRYLSARVPVVLGATALALRGAGVVAVVVALGALLGLLALLVVTIRPRPSADE